jgi:predicted ATP-dependent Lon-type protease
MLRNDISYRDYVKMNMQLENSDDMRDHRSIESGATGLLKILFPDKQPSDEEFMPIVSTPLWRCASDYGMNFVKWIENMCPFDAFCVSRSISTSSQKSKAY